MLLTVDPDLVPRYRYLVVLVGRQGFIDKAKWVGRFGCVWSVESRGLRLEEEERSTSRLSRTQTFAFPLLPQPQPQPQPQQYQHPGRHHGVANDPLGPINCVVLFSILSGFSAPGFFFVAAQRQTGSARKIAGAYAMARNRPDGR